jgi:type VI secretion system secreted protein Hcp
MKGYLQLEGSAQGSIEGESTDAGHEGWIEILGFDHSVTITRDPNGQPKPGKLHHQPLKVTKYIDKASPSLLEAWINSEEFNTFRLEFMRLGGGGLPENYYTVELTNARIVGIRQVKLNTDNPDNNWSQDMESVHFTYDTVIRTFEDGGITYEAAWGYEETRVLRISDLNYDGSVNLFDVAELAAEWLAE